MRALADAPATIDRDGPAAIARLHGELTRPRARALHAILRGIARRRGVRRVVLDFTDVVRLDSAGLAVIALCARAAERSGRAFELAHLGEQHQAALALLPPRGQTLTRPPRTDALEALGGRVIDAGHGVARLGGLIREIARATVAVLARRKKLPAGSISAQLDVMGTGAIPIVALLSFLLGMTMAFQGAVQLARFGAGPYVADMVGMSMVRELSPLMTAVILSGRTGAAIAAELGTMQVRSEIDALQVMGLEPVRFLIVPRLAAITIAGPTLTLLSMFIGIAGGALVASWSLGLPLFAYWDRVVGRVDLGDFAHGLSKSLVFAWIVGVTGSHLGLRAGGDASSVGAATTRTVVLAIAGIIVVDAIFATLWPVGRSTL